MINPACRVYGKGNAQQLLMVSCTLMGMGVAYYYSNGVIRAKSRKVNVINTIEREMRSAGLRTRREYDD